MNHHFPLIRNKFIWREVNEANRKEDENLLSVSQYSGITLKSEAIGEGEFLSRAESLEGYKKVRKGDLVINTMLAWNGSLAISPYDGVVSPAYNVYRLIEKDKWKQEFLHYFLRSDHSKVEYKRHSTGIIESRLRLYPESFLNLKTPMFSVEYQERVGKYIRESENYIQSIKEKLLHKNKMLIEYRAALITQAIEKGLNSSIQMKDTGIDWLGEVPEHWEKAKVKYITKKIGSGKTPSGGAEVYTENGIMFLRSQNIYNIGLRLNDVAFISEEVDRAMKSTRVEYNDTLLNITGGSIGRASIFQLSEPANVNQHVCILRPNKKVIPEYLHYLICSKLIQEQIDLFQNGGNREGLNFEQIANMLLFLPPKNEQEKISAYLHNKLGAIDKLVDLITQQISAIEAYRSALITAAITGQTDVFELDSIDKIGIMKKLNKKVEAIE